MKKLLNILFCIFKYIFFIISFISSLYIVIIMGVKYNKSYFDIFFMFVPYLILLLLFILNIFLKNDKVNKNIFYNITCFLVFLVNSYISYRTIYDHNMVLNKIYGYSINFSYFNDSFLFNNIMLYGLIVSIIFFMFPSDKKELSC